MLLPILSLQQLLSAHCNFESLWTHFPVKTGPSSIWTPPSDAASPLRQAVTSSHSRHLSQKVCVFTKPPANATLTASAGTKPQSSDLGPATKDESRALERRCRARVWVMLSSARRQTGGGEGGRPWPRPRRTHCTRLTDFDIPSDCVCDGWWAGTCQMLYGMRRLFINH